MSANPWKWSLLGGLVLTLGCGTAFSRRPPGVATGVSEVQKRRMERFDPFPDQSAGPGVQSRPREFSLQRTAPRRAKESKVLPGTPGEPEPDVPRQRPLGSEYPGVIRE